MKWNGFECKQFVPVQKLDSTPVYTSILGEIFDITSIMHASEYENRTRLETGLFCQPSTTCNGSLFACLWQVNIITGK